MPYRRPISISRMPSARTMPTSSQQPSSSSKTSTASLPRRPSPWLRNVTRRCWPAGRPDVQARPEAAAIFDFLERHWPRLANSIESRLIPTTNNTVERVIGRFDQHYQNFCGFESSEDAQRYLAVFEKLYRCTPFSQDAQPAVRGKCPLQLAGYDISHLPLATICAGLSVVWPVLTQEAAPVPST